MKAIRKMEPAWESERGLGGQQVGGNPVSAAEQPGSGTLCQLSPPLSQVG